MKKICIVTTSLGSGGAERFSGVLSQMLFQLDYDVHVLTTKNSVDFLYSGQLFNLEKALNGSKSNFEKVRLLIQYFNEHKFDVIIDNRPRSIFFKEFIIYKFLFKAKKILPVVHNYNTENYLPKNKFLAKVLYNNVYRIVCVSEKIKDRIIKEYNFTNVIKIYNPIDFNDVVAKSNVPIPLKNGACYILFFGRIQDKSKNLSLLIKAYRDSELIEKNISLFILGSGEDLDLIKKIVQNLSLTNLVVFLPFTSNPYPYVKQALFTVLTSRYEGFPLSLIESLACGTPVLSVDCNSGPSELIRHMENGLLVENYNEKALSNAMDELVNNESLYTNLKRNASTSIEHLQIKTIAIQWKRLIELDDERH